MEKKELLEDIFYIDKNERVYFWINILNFKNEKSLLKFKPYAGPLSLTERRYYYNINLKKVSINLKNIVYIQTDKVIELLIEHIEIDSINSLKIEENNGYLFRRRNYER